MKQASVLCLGVIKPLTSRIRILASVLLLLFGATISQAQVYEGRTLMEAELLADTKVIVPGEPFYVALRLRHADGWHTYWRFSGDSGLPTSIEWNLPEGFEAGPLLWPLPQRLIEPGNLHVHAYKGEVLLMTEISPPADLQPGETVALKAVAKWLVCEAICIPGKQEVALTLVAGSTVESSPDAALIASWLAKVPSPVSPPYATTWSRTGEGLVLALEGLPQDAVLEFFPLPPEEVTPGHPVVERDGSTGKVLVPLPESDSSENIPGVLKITTTNGNVTGWEIGTNAEVSASAPGQTMAKTQTVPGNLWTFLVYGFLGGLILNLMPCVLPVISLKVFGFIRQAGEEPRRIFQMGMVFVAGMFAWFLGLAALIAAMKGLGREVTWAFQFQNPWFILVMSVVVFVFALNLFGVFEIILPGRAGSELARAGEREGAAGVFFQGVFATVLATPCTAPFLGTALAFAFAQSTAVIFLVFAAIALGMGSPYLVLTARPGWMRFLPRPGAWMEHLKQFMGFLLLATLLWLLWILGHQGGVEAVIWTAAFLLVTAVACWMAGVFLQGRAGARAKWITGTVAVLLMLSSGYLFLGNYFTAAVRSGNSTSSIRQTGGIPWEPFSEERLRAEAGGERMIFVDFTAEWCLSCKFNERTALETDDVRSWLAENNVLPLKADWTNADPEITRALASFGRVGVPFYVIFPAGKGGAPVVLPELLTENIVLEGLREALSRSKPVHGQEPVPVRTTNKPGPESEITTP